MQSPEAFLAELNPEQRRAVETIDGPLLIIAGAGSGKTRVITYRIGYMLLYCGVSPWNILAVTFTNKAAGEMRKRVVERIGQDPGPALQVSTFHSACARLLRRESYKMGISSSFTICDASDQLAVIKDCMKTLDVDKGDIQPGAVQNIISQAKMRLLTAEDYQAAAETTRETLAGRIFTLYDKRLRENDALDFDDLLALCVRLFEESPETLEEYRRRFRYILVDEYQDTNNAQYRLVEALAREHRNLCVVGDEDQSIYSWRGADITNLLDFQNHFPEARIVRLERNYRSTQAILSLANISICNNTERLGKNLWTDRAAGEKPRLIVAESATHEAEQVIERILYHRANGCAYSDMAIFYRANSLSRPFEDQLRKCNVPYRVVGGLRFYDRAEIKDMLAYLQTVDNPNNAIALKRIINRPRRGLGDKSIEALQALADQLGVSCYQAIARGAADGLIKGATAKKMSAFRDSIEKWRAMKQGGAPISDLLSTILKDTAYVESLGDPDDLEVIMRRENVAELTAVINEFQTDSPSAELGDFLEMISLQSSVDDLGEEDALSLMTLHCAKGLEYPVVFMVAVEEPIFPNIQAYEESGNLEEERRLFYVGATRAQDHLYLSRADSRFRFGQTTYNKVSRFLQEIPPSLIEEAEAAPRAAPASWASAGAFQRGKKRQNRPVDRTSVFDRAPRNGGAGAGGGAMAGPYAVGQQVRHPVIGKGAIQDIVKTAGSRRLLIIAFEDGETRALDAATAKLKVL